MFQKASQGSVFTQLFSKNNHCSESVDIGLWRPKLSSLVTWVSVFPHQSPEKDAAMWAQLERPTYVIVSLISINFMRSQRREESVPSCHIRWLIVGPGELVYVLLEITT